MWCPTAFLFGSIFYWYYGMYSSVLRRTGNIFFFAFSFSFYIYFYFYNIDPLKMNAIQILFRQLLNPFFPSVACQCYSTIECVRYTLFQLCCHKTHTVDAVCVSSRKSPSLAIKYRIIIFWGWTCFHLLKYCFESHVNRCFWYLSRFYVLTALGVSQTEKSKVFSIR